MNKICQNVIIVTYTFQAHMYFAKKKVLARIIVSFSVTHTKMCLQKACSLGLIWVSAFHAESHGFESRATTFPIFVFGVFAVWELIYVVLV